MSFWDERFAEDAVYGREPNDFLVAEAGRFPAGGPILSLAEGQGRNAVWLARRGHPVTAVDLSAVGLGKARAWAEENGVSLELLQRDLADYAPPEGAFAGVVSIFCHLPGAVRARVLARAAAALAPGGVLVFEAYTPRQLAFATGGPKDLDLLVEPEALRAELSGLHLAVLREVERDIHEGRLHTGRSAVVQAVAIRPPG